jgi:hypothetical protein
MYFGRKFAWLKYFTYRLVPVLSRNYKHHILSPFINILKRGSYKSLGTSDLE